jgi:hypothetical protein
MHAKERLTATAAAGRRRRPLHQPRDELRVVQRAVTVRVRQIEEGVHLVPVLNISRQEQA